MPLNIHLLGIQGSGKGTQSAKLEKRYGLSYLASGNLFRDRSLVDDELGNRIKNEMKLGHLLPDELLLDVVDDYLTGRAIPVGLLGDGVMRTAKQVELMSNLWIKHSLAEPYMVHLILTEEEAIKRIEHRKEEAESEHLREYHLKYSGKLLTRNDDNPTAISERFRLFHEMTEPVINIFKNNDTYLAINANQAPEKVFEEISEGLESKFRKILAHVTD